MYKLAEGGVIRLADGAFIPADDRNKDWQEYQEWLSQGNTPMPQFNLQELRTKIRAEILSLREGRIQSILRSPENMYDSLADVLFYAQLGDQDAQKILDWYKVYDDLIWNFLDLTLPTLSETQLQSLNPATLEESLFKDSQSPAQGSQP